MHSQQEQSAYNNVVTCRMAIILSGLRLEPTRERLWDLAVCVGIESCEELAGVTNPWEAQWPLYHCAPNAEDPMEMVYMPAWLVRGVQELTKNTEFDYSSIDPMAWVDQLDRVVEQAPQGFFAPVELEILEALKRSMVEDDTMQILRKCIRRKQEAVELHRGLAPSTQSTH